jgi:hypothetical protein
MIAVLDLIGMYSEINSEIIGKNLDRKGMTQDFRKATNSLLKIK